jgi:hypothetical protein
MHLLLGRPLPCQGLPGDSTIAQSYFPRYFPVIFNRGSSQETEFTHVKPIKGWKHNFKSSAIVNSDGFQGRSGYHPGEDDVSLDLLADTAKPWTS